MSISSSLLRPALAALLAHAAACTAGPAPIGLQAAATGSGPQVIFDFEALPIPDIPLPIDLATRVDPRSATGRRVNLTLRAASELERRFRRGLAELDGFSTFGPITVRFSAPLDVAELLRRQRDNDDPADDAVLLVDVDPASPEHGAAVALDFDRGSYPMPQARLGAYGPNDPRAAVANLYFDTVDEDADGDGELDAGEDTDGDGYLDRPNLWPGGKHPVDDLLTCYERVTDTLVMRPVVPLRPRTRYAVVLTRRLIGEDGQPVRSPFPAVHHLRQTHALAGLPAVLERHGLGLGDVAFAWSFTTQSISDELEALRRGLYGVGPFARLAREFPPTMVLRRAHTGDGNPYLLPSPAIQSFAKLVGPTIVSLAAQGMLGGDAGGVQLTADSYKNVAHVVLGAVPGPNLLADKDGHAAPGYPADEDETWQLDARSGEAFYRTHAIPFWCTIPHATRGAGPPFPVVIYTHGYGTTRAEMIAFAGYFARYGFAACAIDNVGHGLALPEQYAPVAELLARNLKMEPTLAELAPGRARDLDNDGDPDNGGDFFGLDMFHARDVLRQSVLDHLVLMRLLRSFDGVRRGSQDLDGDGQPELLGDLDGDGRVDLGGPGVDYFGMGTSMGAVLSMVFAAVEPNLTAVVPSAGGGGLEHVVGRTVLGAIAEGLVLRAMGPVLLGMPGAQPGTTDVQMLVTNVTAAKRHPIRRGLVLRAGDRVELHNLTSGEHSVAYVDARARFRVHVAATALEPAERRVRFGLDPRGEPKTARLSDTTVAGDRLELRIYDAEASTPRYVIDRFSEELAFQGLVYPAGGELVALSGGLGLQRNTPALRRLFGIGQMALDRADPVSYARHWAREPLPTRDYDAAEPGASVLVLGVAGDTIVPPSTTVAVARAAGIVGHAEPDPRFGKPANRVLAEGYVIEGLARLKRFGAEVVADPEDLSAGRHAPDVPRLAAPLRLTLREGGRIVALRLPLLAPAGQHAFAVPEPLSDFDTPTMLIHMIGDFFRSRGTRLREEPCMADASCDWIPAAPPQ